jgi:hypothetical protein
MTCPCCNDTGEQRYWEGRWRDEIAENERLRARLGIAIIALRQLEEATGESYDDEGGDIAGIEAELRADGAAKDGNG